MKNEIIENISKSKNYNVVCESTIKKTVENEIPKYKKKKDVEQSVRAKLHAWVTMFYENYNKAIKNIDSSEDVLDAILKSHVSTKERYEFLEEFFRDIENTITKKTSILDLGAGFNPIAYFKFANNKNVEYVAVDAEVKGVEILNKCFKELQVNAKAFGADVLMFETDKQFDVIFMFKLLPLLEQQKKGSSIDIIKKLNANYYCVSYPTKTLSGKNVGMREKYKKDIEKILEETNLNVVFEKEYRNELLFILAK